MSWRPTAGFTITQLIAVLAVAAILAALAAPVYSGLILDSRMVTQLNKLMGHLNYARGEAVKRGLAVAVCATTDQASCNGGNNWEGGYLVFVNIDADDPPQVDAGETVLRVTEAIGAAFSIRSADFGGAIYYRSTAFPNAPGTFTLCDPRGPGKARGLLVNGAGRARISQDTDGDGVHEDRNGTALACA